MSSEKRFLPNLIAQQHNPNSNLQLQECKILNTVLILHYKDGMFDRWKESKSSQPGQIARALKIDNWNVVCSLQSVSLIFEEPIKVSMHHIKHEFFMHRHETAREEGYSMPLPSSSCQDIHRNQCAPPAAEETQIQNRQLRPAWRSDFGHGRRSSVFRRS